MKVEIEINTLGDYLYFKRKNLKLSLRDVEKKTGVCNPTICSAEHNKNIKLITGIKLFAFYGITIEEANKFLTNKCTGRAENARQ